MTLLLVQQRRVNFLRNVAALPRSRGLHAATAWMSGQGSVYTPSDTDVSQTSYIGHIGLLAPSP
jgi:hypothetical protein